MKTRLDFPKQKIIIDSIEKEASFVIVIENVGIFVEIEDLKNLILKYSNALVKDVNRYILI